MAKRTHEMEKLGEIKKEWGFLRYFFPNHLNNAFVLYFNQINKETGAIIEYDDTNLVFEGKLVDTLDFAKLRQLSLSFDGKKLAITKQDLSNPWQWVVYVNGKPIWNSPAGFEVDHLTWLDNERIAWSGGYVDQDGRPQHEKGEKYFVNGKEQSNDFSFCLMIGKRDQSLILVRENGRRYVIYDDGSRHDDRSDCCDKLTSCWCHDGEPRPEIVQPNEERDEANQQVRVSFNNQTGEWFDDLEDHSGMRTYSFNNDRSHCGYIGIKYPSWVTKFSSWFGKKMEKREETKKNDRISWWMWSGILLMSPYSMFTPFGNGSRPLKRYYPVNNGKTWKKGWSFANDHFLTPQNELVVTCFQDNKLRVVIDEDEGPVFDEVYNVRYLKDENCVCYLGRRGLEIMRVTIRPNDAR